MKLLSSLLIGILLVSGCSQVNINDGEQQTIIPPVMDGEYTFILPYGSNDVRQIHNNYKRSKLDVEAIGQGMIELSKKHFPVKDYFIQEGQMVGYNQLTSLLQRVSVDNPFGLNPEKGSNFPSGDGIDILDAVLIRDIYEIDFLKSINTGYEVSALSFAIVINPKQEVDDGLWGQTVTITDEALMAYGSEAAIRFEQYLRTIPEVGNIPIYMMLFKAGSSDQNLPGSFFGEALFDSRTANFSRIYEEWALFPSGRATALDSIVAAQFQEIRKKLEMFLPEDIGIVGKGRYVDSKLKELNITVNMQAKTYLEILGLVQYLDSLLENFVDASFGIKVDVRSSGETKATMQKEPKKTSVITILD